MCKSYVILKSKLFVDIIRLAVSINIRSEMIVKDKKYAVCSRAFLYGNC